MIRRHRIVHAEARRLAALCGPLDMHLRHIEQALAVRISRREAEFRIEGERDAVQRTTALLDRLHDIATRDFDEERLRLMLVEAAGPPGASAGRTAGSAARAAATGAAAVTATPAAQAREPKPASPATAGPQARHATPAAHGAHAARAAPDAGTAHAARATPDAGTDHSLVLHTRHADLAGRTPNQVQYLRQILEHDITFGIGPAGTGKTFLAVACAVDALERQGVQRIVLTRPAVEAGERLGFLPGDLAQKVDPYLRPLYDALYDLMGFERVGKAFEKGQIEIAPLAFMRGRTLNHAFVILDEAQNTTREQMKMFLTRMGFRSRCVVTGDVSQIDLPRGQASGLIEARHLLAQVKGIAFTDFTAADVVRHPLVARIVQAYDADAAAQAGPPGAAPGARPR